MVDGSAELQQRSRAGASSSEEALSGGSARVSLSQYDITIEPGSLNNIGKIAQSVAPAHRYAIISDSIVGPLYGDRIVAQFPDQSAMLFTFESGEVNKNRDTWATLTDQLLANGYGRDSAIIALGGGVAGDMAGFVAATYMRGIPFIQVPTTLLAMIDASIGGKTGVDTPAGKNLVGAFYPPRAVVIDPKALDTLPVPHLREGLAEAVKHSAIADETYFSFLEDGAGQLLLLPNAESRDVDFTFRLIERSVQIKADVVARDEHELGIRKILNFGHTIGHAIELLSDFTVAHGEAVAIGMVLESQAGEAAGITEPGTTARLANALSKLGLPTQRPTGPSPDQIIDLMRGDKKARSGSIEYAIPVRLGVMANAESGFGVRIDDAIVRKILE